MFRGGSLMRMRLANSRACSLQCAAQNGLVKDVRGNLDGQFRAALENASQLSEFGFKSGSAVSEMIVNWDRSFHGTELSKSAAKRPARVEALLLFT
jgi:hypothetical protein